MDSHLTELDRIRLEKHLVTGYRNVGVGASSGSALTTADTITTEIEFPMMIESPTCTCGLTVEVTPLTAHPDNPATQQPTEPSIRG